MKKTLTVKRTDLKNKPFKYAEKEIIGTAPKKRKTDELTELLRVVR